MRRRIVPVYEIAQVFLHATIKDVRSRKMVSGVILAFNQDTVNNVSLTIRE